MKTRYYLLIAAAALFASCQKEALVQEEPVANGQKTVLTVGLAPQTKTHMDGASGTSHKVYWSDGDQIAVNGTASDALSGLGEDVQSTQFTFQGLLSTPYNVIYPASIYSDATHVALPASQTYKADGFADGMFPMAGYSADGSNINLSHLCAIVKISVKRASANADEDNIAAVRFKGKNNEKVSGSFEIDYATPALVNATGSGSELEVRVQKNLATSTSSAAVYYLVVPARAYANGFDVIVQDVNGHIMTKSTTSAKTLVAGHLYAMPEFEFIPTGTELGIEISNAQELIDFATAYNNKEYQYLGSNLIATVTDDITFDASTSAAFNATGGIGLKINYFGDAEDMYFDGVFNGSDHTISGLAATTPLFKATSQSGQVKDLTIDSSCSFTFTHSNVSEMYACALVGYHRGLVEHATVEADVTLEGASVTKGTALGGIVGRAVTGEVKDCIYSGNITVPDTFVVDNQKTYVGGLVGYISNPDGKVTDSDFEGTIDFAGTVASTDKNNPYLFIGGIIGSNAGTVSGCEAKATNTKEITMDNDKSYVATILNHSRKAYHLAQGGIAGQNSLTVSNCTNSASIKNFVLSNATKGGTAADANSRYYDLGGIVGLNLAAGTVSGCVNDALIETRATPRIQKIGGVVAYNQGAVSSSSNTSAGSIYITTTNITPYSVRVGEVGGAIGKNEGTVSDVQNAGNITLDRTENNAGVELKFGGVIGLTTTAIDGGSSKAISNSGNISIQYNGSTVTTDGLRFGGVAGESGASVENVSNTGSVSYSTSATNVVSKLYMGGIVGAIRNASSAQVAGCENEGEVFFNVAHNAAHSDNYAGGIIGKTFDSNVTISNCTNAGYIHGGNTTKQNGTTFYVGGIVAYLDGVSSIADCENNGILLNNQFNNTNTKVGSTFEGGIAGFVLGTADDRISISNVTNDVNSGATTTGGRRGYTGGAVAYGEYVDIDNATNTNSYGGGSGYWYGGIAGWLVNSTVSNSTYSGTSVESSQVQGVGGIVCTLDAGSTVSNCNSYLNSITHGGNACVDGDVAGKSVAGSTIQNCHYTGAYGICSDTNFTDGGGNVADL